ncbi:MAG: WXG100 family type VII secretion target [Actinomycetota bacterium]|nr:WXG100 family type VII secretion target [Actinomycetota bacterium]
MADIKVTSEELHSVSSSLQHGSEDVANQLAQMRSQVQGLVDSNWQGAASNSFRDLFDKWHKGAADVKEALDGISHMLGSAADTYERTESELARSMGQG